VPGPHTAEPHPFETGHVRQGSGGDHRAAQIGAGGCRGKDEEPARGTAGQAQLSACAQPRLDQGVGGRDQVFHRAWLVASRTTKVPCASGVATSAHVRHRVATTGEQPGQDGGAETELAWTAETAVCVKEGRPRSGGPGQGKDGDRYFCAVLGT